MNNNKSNNEEIVTALETTAPEFIAAYERKTTKGVNIRDMLAESDKLHVELNKYYWVTAPYVAGTCGGVMFSGALINTIVFHNLFVGLTVLILWLACFFWFLFWNDDRKAKIKEKLSAIEKPLHTFLDSVNNLDPLITNLRKGDYEVMTEAITLAQNVLLSKKAFNLARFEPTRPIIEVVSLGNNVIASERKFESFWLAAEKFGIFEPGDFDKKRIFNLAGRRLECVRPQPLDEDEVPPGAARRFGFADRKEDASKSQKS